jgi:hypothetical protein
MLRFLTIILRGIYTVCDVECKAIAEVVDFNIRNDLIIVSIYLEYKIFNYL